MLFRSLAVNDSLGLGYKLHYWRTANGEEVDFVLYGPHGLLAFEVKRSSRTGSEALSGLKAFLKDYPEARAILAYGGERRLQLGPVEAWPLQVLLPELPRLLSGP